MSNTSPSLPPGFRFHPTDEELILHYLYKRVASPRCPITIIADINIYNFNPWDLPAKAMFGEREWYFFSPRDRKYPNGVRPNRSAGSGYWKATGTDKPIENIGVKKALVFYKGKPPKAMKTDWIMHEYRLADSLLCNPNKNLKPNRGSMRLDDWVLCRIYQKHRHHSPESCRPEEVTEMKNFANTNKMHKTFSVSEFLIADEEMSFLPGLLETPADVPPLSNPDPLFCFGSQTGDPESSVFLHEQSLKRQKMVEKYNFDDCGGQLNSSNKFRSSNMYDQFWNQIDLSHFLDPATCSEFPLTK